MSKLRLSKHSLHGDATMTKLFYHLHEKDKELNSCRVLVPDTVVYEHNFPNGWYHYESNEIRQKKGKDIEPRAILQEFARKYRREQKDENGHGILAYYLSCTEDENGQEVNQVEFFNEEQLEEFFFKRKNRERGILQRFVTPKGPNNFIIQAIWSPHVMMLERRVNIHRLADTKNFNAFERAVTYEGPSHYSNEVFCAPHLQKEIKSVCNDIVKHLASGEKKIDVTRMVLYFKIGCDNRLYFLWSSSIRVAQGGAAAPKTATTTTTNASTTNASTQGANATGVEGGTQTKHAHLDAPRSMPLNLSPKFNVDSSLKQDKTFDALSLLPSTMADKAIDLTQSLSVPTRTQYEDMRRAAKTRPPASSTSNSIRKSQSADATDNQDQSETKQNEDQQKKTNNQATITLSEEDRQKVDLISEGLDNMMYEAYSHFLEGATSPFIFNLSDIPEVLKDEFLPQLVEGLTSFLKAETQCSEQEGGGEDENGEEANDGEEANGEEEEETSSPQNDVIVLHRPCSSINKLQHELDEFRRYILDQYKQYLSGNAGSSDDY